MTTIRVNPEQLEQIASQIFTGIRDMDTAMSDAYHQLHSIRDRARGLDDIRSRASNLYHMHRSQHDSAQQVHRHLTQSAQRFSDEDRQLAEMIHARYLEQLPIWQQMLATTAIGTLTYGQLLDMMAEFTGTARDQIEHVMGLMGDAKDFFQQFAMLNHLNRTDVREALLNVGRNVNDYAKLLGVDAQFVGKMQGVYNLIKDFVPDGRTGFGQLIKSVGSFASDNAVAIGNVMTYGSLALSVIGAIDPTIKAFQTGDFREVKDMGLTFGSEFLVNKLVVGGLGVALAGTAGATVGGTIAAGVAIAVVGTETIQLVGGKVMDVAEWAGFTEFAEGGRALLDQIEVKDRLVAGTKWVIEGTATGVVEVLNHPQESLQNSIDYVGEKVNQVSQVAHDAYDAMSNTAQQVKNAIFGRVFA